MKRKLNKFATLIKAITALRISKDDKKPWEILPNLYIGSIGAAMNREAIEEIGITHILITAANLNPAFQSKEPGVSIFYGAVFFELLWNSDIV